MGAHPAIEPRHGLDVVVEHLGPGAHHRVERVPVPLEVGDQDLDRDVRPAGAHLLADDSAYRARRIELGRPAPGAELTDEYNPLEAGLAQSFGSGTDNVLANCPELKSQN